MSRDWTVDEWFFADPENADPPEEPKPAKIRPSSENPPSPDRDSIERVRAYVSANAERGISCPCCDQLVKVYRRKLNANMTRFLCSLVRIYLSRGRGSWISFKDCEFDGRDYPCVAMWGLAETKGSEDSGKKNSGLWRPTQKGIDFVLAGLRVPSHVHVLNNNVIGWSEETAGVRESLGSAFSYDELMQ
jgi:hypothetical protein